MEVMVLKVMTQQFLCSYTHTHTGWGVAVSCIIFSCATGYGGNGSKSHDSAIFMLVHTHTGWGVAVSWIIFSCATGYGGNGSKSHDSAIFMLVHTHTHTHTLVGVLLLVGSSSLVLLDMEVG